MSVDLVGVVAAAMVLMVLSWTIGNSACTLPFSSEIRRSLLFPHTTVYNPMTMINAPMMLHRAISC